MALRSACAKVRQPKVATLRLWPFRCRSNRRHRSQLQPEQPAAPQPPQPQPAAMQLQPAAMQPPQPPQPLQPMHMPSLLPPPAGSALPQQYPAGPSSLTASEPWHPVLEATASGAAAASGAGAGSGAAVPLLRASPAKRRTAAQPQPVAAQVAAQGRAPGRPAPDGGGKSHVCTWPDCGKGFHSRWALERHAQNHTEAQEVDASGADADSFVERRLSERLRGVEQLLEKTREKLETQNQQQQQAGAELIEARAQQAAQNAEIDRLQLQTRQLSALLDVAPPPFDFLGGGAAAPGLPDLAEANGALVAAVAEDTPKSWEAASMLGKLAAVESEAAG